MNDDDILFFKEFNVPNKWNCGLENEKFVCKKEGFGHEIAIWKEKDDKWHGSWDENLSLQFRQTIVDVASCIMNLGYAQDNVQRQSMSSHKGRYIIEKNKEKRACIQNALTNEIPEMQQAHNYEADIPLSDDDTQNFGFGL